MTLLQRPVDAAIMEIVDLGPLVLNVTLRLESALALLIMTVLPVTLGSSVILTQTPADVPAPWTAKTHITGSNVLQAVNVVA